MKRVGLIVSNLAGNGTEKILLQMARMFKSKNIITYDNINDLETHLLSENRDIYKALKIFEKKLLVSKLKKIVEKILRALA